MVKEVRGNLLDAKEEVIAHQVNCKGVMGSSQDTKRTTNVAHQLRMKYGNNLFFPYRKLVTDKGKALLGDIQMLIMPDGKMICNLFGQGSYGYDKKMYTSLEALEKCLKKLERVCSTNNIGSVAVPYKLASNRGGANWEDVQSILHSIFDDSRVELVIYKL